MKIAVVNGPNLNLLGKRDKTHYGTLTLEEIKGMLCAEFMNIDFDFFQSNTEGSIINKLQSLSGFDGADNKSGRICAYFRSYKRCSC